MAELRQSLIYSAADSYAALVLQLGSTVVLSRLLTPTELGVFAVAAVFASLASTFRDFGVAEYMIQEKALSAEKIRAAFAVNIGISWLMALIIFAGAGPVGELYSASGITEVMRVQALNFLLIPFGAVTMAYFRRQMDFRPIFVAGLAANTTAFAVSVACAHHGMGYMSLAWSSVAGVCVTVVVSIWLRPRGFPCWPSLRGISEVLHFGKFASGIYIFGQLGKGAPEMIIGRAQGMAEVAVFSRANGLVQVFHELIVRAVMPTCLPYFSAAVRAEGSVVRGYVTGVSYLTTIGWPFLGFMAAAAFPAIRIVYGDQWDESVPLARTLCLAGAIELVHYLANEALLAHGQVRLGSRLQLLLQAARVLGLLAVIPFGLAGGCWGLVAAAAAGLTLSQWHLKMGAGLTLGDLWRACRGSLVVTVITLAPLLITLPLITVDEHNYVRFMVLGGAVTAAMWLLALGLTRHALGAELIRLLRHLRTRLPALRAPPTSRP